MQQSTFFKSIDEVKSLLQLKKAPLKHQFDALNIVKSMPYNQGFLIADEPGLGKTFTCLMLIKMRWLTQLKFLSKCPNVFTLPSLVIVPLAALEVWKKEVKDVFNDDEVFVYYGSNRNQKLPSKKIALYITTHGIIQSEGEKFLDEKVFCFDAVVVDEGHILHRASSDMLGACSFKKRKVSPHLNTSDAIMLLKKRSRVRFVLTGTPFRNKLRDIESIRLFVDDDSVQKVVTGDNKTQQEPIDLELLKDEDIVHPDVFVDNQEQVLKDWIKTHMIRRTKTDIMVENSNLVIRKKEILQHVLSFSPYEEAIMQSLRNDLQKNVTAELSNHFPLHILGKMRQCCVSDLFIISDGVQWIDTCHEEMMKSGNKKCPFVSKEDQKRALDSLNRSTKLKRVIHDLFLFSLTDDKTAKVIVVISHFVKTLKLIDILLSFKGTYDLCAPDEVKQKMKPIRLDTLMYSGDIDLHERDLVLQKARNVQRPTVLLVSLQSGNACIDMTFSSCFMFVDRWWTPSTEFQMQERGHRFVTREMFEKEPVVYIHYYTMNNSVEDFQELIQTRKYEQEMEFFGDTLQLEMARAKRGFMEQKLNKI